MLRHCMTDDVRPGHQFVVFCWLLSEDTSFSCADVLIATRLSTPALFLALILVLVSVVLIAVSLRWTSTLSMLERDAACLFTFIAMLM